MSFQMQAWRQAEKRWEPMENGAGARKWRPRPTAAEAIAQCDAWTGGLGIPAMQVVDPKTGRASRCAASRVDDRTPSPSPTSRAASAPRSTSSDRPIHRTRGKRR